MERGRLSHNLNVGYSLNFLDSKMSTRVTYCASLDEFLFGERSRMTSAAEGGGGFEMLTRGGGGISLADVSDGSSCDCN